MPSSISSTTCSTPTNDTVQTVIKNDTVRYKRKGYGLISASLLAFSFFYFAPDVIKSFWPSLLENYSAEYIVFFGTLIIHSGVYALSNLIMYCIYKMKLPFFENYRILNKPWPWESQPEVWTQILKKTMKILFVSHLVIVPLLTFSELKTGGVNMKLDMGSFPTKTEILSQIVFFMICEDFFFYWGHRFLHWKRIFPYIHKLHHEYNITVSIAAEYAHPLEFIIGNLIPTNAGPKILGGNVHFITYCLWIIIRLMETVDGHCGYEFSWSPFRLIPFSGSSTYHNFHHSHNVGNFGSFFTWWDTICGTNRRYFSHLAKQQKQELANRIRNENKNLAERIDTHQNTHVAREGERNTETQSQTPSTNS